VKNNKTTIVSKKAFLTDPGNQEFRTLLERSKWTQSESARQLKVSPGLVSQYLSGLTRPSTTTLTLFRMILEKRDLLTQGNDFEAPTLASLRDSSEKLLEIAKADPEKLTTVHEVIKLAYSNLPVKKNTRKRS
jgi:transcriptional regulator with XRE-family HTH domain